MSKHTRRQMLVLPSRCLMRPAADIFWYFLQYFLLSQQQNWLKKTENVIFTWNFNSSNWAASFKIFTCSKFTRETLEKKSEKYVQVCWILLFLLFCLFSAANSSLIYMQHWYVKYLLVIFTFFLLMPAKSFLWLIITY